MDILAAIQKELTSRKLTTKESVFTLYGRDHKAYSVMFNGSIVMVFSIMKSFKTKSWRNALEQECKTNNILIVFGEKIHITGSELPSELELTNFSGWQTAHNRFSPLVKIIKCNNSSPAIARIAASNGQLSNRHLDQFKKAIDVATDNNDKISSASIGKVIKPIAECYIGSGFSYIAHSLADELPITTNNIKLDESENSIRSDLVGELKILSEKSPFCFIVKPQGDFDFTSGEFTCNRIRITLDRNNMNKNCTSIDFIPFMKKLQSFSVWGNTSSNVVNYINGSMPVCCENTKLNAFGASCFEISGTHIITGQRLNKSSYDILYFTKTVEINNYEDFKADLEPVVVLIKSILKSIKEHTIK